MSSFHSQPLRVILGSLLFLGAAVHIKAQEQSIVRQWSEQVRGAIRRDFARPPVHARNLFHVHAAMYDAWSAFEPGADSWLLGKTRGNYTCAFLGVPVPEDVVAAQAEAISYAAYRIIAHRFQFSPGQATTMAIIQGMMQDLGYDHLYTSTDYLTGGPAALGNYIGQEYISFGFYDGSNETNNHAHQYYTVFNPPIEAEEPGNPNMLDPNRWQQITLTNAIDQQGNPVPSTPPPVGHEWGDVVPFALDPSQADVYTRDGAQYRVYHDPGAPAYLDTLDSSGLESFYKWNFVMVAIWQSHLDPADETIWDISPGAKGNITSYPTTWEEYSDFYNFFDGGETGEGHALNPATGMPYEPQLVKRGDYARILAEFWADGPSSETPPGHWFEIMHHTMDHPQFSRKWMGLGDELSPVEFDVKAHMAMGSAMHDAAITAWSIKGWYDYVRPVSALRYMGDKGQCTDQLASNYHPAGLPLIPGYVETVETGDPLAGENDEHVGKIKLYTWKGHDHIEDIETDHAGVGWILCEDWWPYQRPTFVTPPFAGYISGHSTYSSTAAQVMERFTGDPFFPGGMSNFECLQDEFLQFENGPSETIYLQWATYRDASDQCSLSRIWGGIHPPVDDIAGRFIGMEIGDEVMNTANTLFQNDRPVLLSVTASDTELSIIDIGQQFTLTVVYDRPMNTAFQPQIAYLVEDPLGNALALNSAGWSDANTFVLTYTLLDVEVRMPNILVQVNSAISSEGRVQDVHVTARPFVIDTDRPVVVALEPQQGLINDAVAMQGTFALGITFQEPCDQTTHPVISFPGSPTMNGTLAINNALSTWSSATRFDAVFDVSDANVEIPASAVRVEGARDLLGNGQVDSTATELIAVDTRNPELLGLEINDTMLNEQNVGASALVMTLLFDEDMNTDLTPGFQFPDDNPVGTSLQLNPGNSFWVNSTTYQIAFNLLNAQEEHFNINVLLQGFRDHASNDPAQALLTQPFSIDTRRPEVSVAAPSVSVVADAQVGPAGFSVSVQYSEAMDQQQAPLVQLTGASGLNGSFTPSLATSGWDNANTYVARFNVADQGREEAALGVSVGFARDAAGNPQQSFAVGGLFQLDTRNPEVVLFTANSYNVTNAFMGEGGLVFAAVFDEPMNVVEHPALSFSPSGPINDALVANPDLSLWLASSTYRFSFDVANMDLQAGPFSVTLGNAFDLVGNPVEGSLYPDFFVLDLSAVGIASNNGLAGSSVYPNPLRSAEMLWIRTDRAYPRTDLILHDAQGRVVYRNTLDLASAGTHAVRLPELSAGNYFMELHNDAAHHTWQLLIVAQ